MYGLVLILHSLVRWVVIGTAVWAITRAFQGWRANAPFTDADRRAGRWLTMALDIQLLLGLGLYLFLSPLTTAALGDMGAAMRDSTLRFWAVEHTSVMLIAVVLAHLGKVRSGRATGDGVRHRKALVYYGAALLAVVLATPWPFSSEVRPLLRLGF
jgi:hypothetical protein